MLPRKLYICLPPALPSSVFNPSCEIKVFRSHHHSSYSSYRKHPDVRPSPSPTSSFSFIQEPPTIVLTRSFPFSFPRLLEKVYRGSLLGCRGCGFKSDADLRAHRCPILLGLLFPPTSLGPTPCLRPLLAYGARGLATLRQRHWLINRSHNGIDLSYIMAQGLIR